MCVGDDGRVMGMGTGAIRSTTCFVTIKITGTLSSGPNDTVWVMPSVPRQLLTTINTFRNEFRNKIIYEKTTTSLFHKSFSKNVKFL